MGVTSLTKQKGGAALIQNFKNIFPDQIDKLYIYQGTNLLSKGENIIAREDYQTTISLTLIKEVDVVYGGEAYAAAARTVQEEKKIKELTRDVLNTSSVTAFLRDLDGIDLNDDTLYYTISEQFIESDDKKEQLKVMSFSNIVPNVLTKLIAGGVTLTSSQHNLITNNRSISFNFTPAILEDTLSGSKMKFVDGTIYKKLPVNETDFEITSFDIESDHTFLPEYGNGFKARGVIETQTGLNEEIDINLKTDKPLMPINVNPYAKNGNLQFAIANFNRHMYMPWLYSKKFLSADKNIKGYITQGQTGQDMDDLVSAVVDMFRLSHAFSTNFSEYRNGQGEVQNETIGGVSLKSLESKDAVTAVDAVMKNFEYKHPTSVGKDPYIRALQILAASSQWISSSYCIAKGLTQFHKSLLDFYLRLDTQINKDTTDIDMTLESLRYSFTYEQIPNPNYDSDIPEDPDTNPQTIDDLTKPIINLIPLLSQSEIVIDETDRYISLAEIDDPINTTTFVTFAGDIDSTNQASLKYKVSLDITDPKDIANFFIDSETSNEIIITKDLPAVSTPWFVLKLPDAVGNTRNVGVVAGQTIDGVPVDILVNPIPEDIIRKSVSIPSSAYDLTVESIGTRTSITRSINYHREYFNAARGWIQGTYSSTSEIYRYTGAVVSYKIKTTSHGVENKVIAYNKGTFFNMMQQYTKDDKWKRNFSITDDYRNDQEISSVKIKTIDRIYLSFVLGNYVDITLNYQYTQTTKIANDPSSVIKVPITKQNLIGNDDDSAQSVTTNVIVTGTELLPRIELPSKTDETRTKLGISL